MDQLPSWNDGLANPDRCLFNGRLQTNRHFERRTRNQRSPTIDLHRQVLLVGNWLFHNVGHNIGPCRLLHLLGLLGLGTWFLHLFIVLLGSSAFLLRRFHGPGRRTFR